MQFFVRPGSELEWFEKMEKRSSCLHKALDLVTRNIATTITRSCALRQRSHRYRVEFPFGFKELGVSTPVPISTLRSIRYSPDAKCNISIPRPANYVPYVVETSIGLDRTFLAILSAAYSEEELRMESRG